MSAESPLESLRQRARDGALTPHDVHFLHHHLADGTPDAARIAAIEVAGAFLRVREGPALILRLIEIAEGSDSPVQRTAAVKALAGATGYHGQPLAFEP